MRIEMPDRRFDRICNSGALAPERTIRGFLD